jgi:hypothetical protein
MRRILIALVVLATSGVVALAQATLPGTLPPAPPIPPPPPLVAPPPVPSVVTPVPSPTYGVPRGAAYGAPVIRDSYSYRPRPKPRQKKKRRLRPRTSEVLFIRTI